MAIRYKICKEHNKIVGIERISGLSDVIEYIECRCLYLGVSENLK
ncbi:MAG: hypothetical protein QW052_06245 [Candidatus Nitrosocaldaceae archaeon]